MFDKDSFTIENVEMNTSKGPITKASIIDEICSENKIWKLPDSFFGDNSILVSTPFYKLSLSSIESVKYLRYSHLISKLYNPDFQTSNLVQLPLVFQNDIKVSNSQNWTSLTHDNLPIKEQTLDQDWTFLNHFPGFLSIFPSAKFTREISGMEIPKNRLGQENKILFYKDLFLYEDDLGDFGYSCLRVRFRVQKDCAFALMRSYVRIDGARIRSIDCRIFIDFADYSLTRELLYSDSTYQEIKDAGFVFEPGFNNDNDQTDKVARFLKPIGKFTERLAFQDLGINK